VDVVDTDVAAFARQLRQDGIEAARAEAERILAEARGQAAGILQEAGAAAEKAQGEARAEIERERRRFAAEIGMAARDAMLQVRQQIEQVVLRLLRAKIADALATDEVVRTAVSELIRNPAPGSAWEIAFGPRIGRDLVAAAVSDLFKGREATVALVEEFGRSGLEFRSAGGAEVLELSEESVAEAFRRMLSPELTRLIDSLPD
jgi:V/A-type H+-transporting ATPase subunit E